MTMNRKPRAFIGSSREAIPYAKEIAAALERVIEVNSWYASTFEANDYTMEALDRELNANDFGIFVFAADDVATIRNQTHFVTRDNTLFEMGLFWGRLGRRRVFCILPQTVPPSQDGETGSFHLPSDLDGLTLLKYTDHPRLSESVQTACSRILEAVSREGLFKQKHEILAESEALIQQKNSVLQFFFEYLRNVTVPNLGEQYSAIAEAIRNSILPPNGFRTTGAAIWKQIDDEHIGQVGGNVGRGKKYHLSANDGKLPEEEQISVLKVFGTKDWTFFSRRQIADVHILCYSLGMEHVLSVHFSGNRGLEAEHVKEIVEDNDDLLLTIKDLIGGIRNE
ncbi:TIR domain-containing protein [Paenibacillus sp. D51F]